MPTYDLDCVESLGFADISAATVISVFEVTAVESLGFSDTNQITSMEFLENGVEALALSDAATVIVAKVIQLESGIKLNDVIQLESGINPLALSPPTNVMTANLNTGNSMLVAWDNPTGGEFNGIDIYIDTDEFGSYTTKVNNNPITGTYTILENLAVNTYYIKLVSKSTRGVGFDSVKSAVSVDADLTATSGSFRFTGPNGDTIGANTVFAKKSGNEVIGYKTSTGGTMTPDLDVTMTSIKKGPQYILANAADFQWTSSDTLVTLQNLGATTGGIAASGGGPGTLLTDDHSSPDPDDVTIYTDLHRSNT